ncbi:hypothetical protein FOF46_30745 [Aquimarina algiphila]|uniref:Uncharacterized protein n=3 Tax=Aquimarina algiphila TaxID=2047982 RepID=A0A554VA44_9FLAO|nr:hypothetical protein [Aquimarina algiphila]TSE02379.1 hypothetical protein FOF46_30925 [Aquimarina algiphila]TSE02604.1 hypothetical protein FOF46_30745 [Aquimarina algiphila]
MRQLDKEGNPIPFSMEVRTWNNQNKMGGKLKVYENAVLCMPKEKEKVRDWAKVLSVKTQEVKRKNPNHFKNYTRNIELSTGEVKKINILLITKFNGLEVVY